MTRLQGRPVGPLGWSAWLLLVGAGLAMAATLNGYYVYVLANVALLAIVGIGMNVLLGMAGQVSFGHVGFYAIGAYAVAVLTGKLGLSFWLAWPIGIVLSGAVGLLLAVPALRVKGPYLAMVTIAFGFIVEHGVVEWRDVTGGQNGIMGIGAPALGDWLSGERAVAALAVLACAGLLLLYAWMDKSAWGAALRAVRDSEVASESIGISPVRTKAVAFAVSAALAGMAGGLFAPLSGFVTPQTFGMLQSILFVLVVMVGGAGTVVGPLVGALVVGLLPEVLSGMEEYRLLFFGVLLLVVLWAAPQGLVGLARRLWPQPAPAEAPAPVATAPLAPHGDGAATHGVLAVRGLGRQFGGVRAVHALSFDTVPAGVTSLIGPNGAGKTTVLNMLSGFYRPTAGGFSLQGAALQGRAAHALARSGIARTYQTSQLFGTLSVLDNVVLGLCRGRLGSPLAAGRFQSPQMQARARTLLAQCGYTGAVHSPAADLAHVDKRLVEIARALATAPQVLLLDEPAAGLSREDKTRLGGLLRTIADSGIGVVIVEHDMAMVMDLSDRIVVLDAGQRLAHGTPAEVRADPAVRQAYLGDAGLQGGAAIAARPQVAPAPEVLGIGALQTGYGAEPVLHGVALSVREGQMAALLGANGAGKSTLMRSLAGLHRPVAGGIHLRGRELAGLQAEQIAALGLVLVPEGRQVFPELSVLDNLRLGAFLKPQGREARVADMLERFPRLRERLHQRAGLLSGGEQQMLAIARGLMAQPQVLLLDEPSLGLAPKVIEDLFAVLSRLRDERMTLLLVDQMAGLALSLADHAYVLESGRIVAQGSAAELLADGALMRAYLGA